MPYNFDKKIETKHFTVQVDTGAQYGYFEHNTLGEDCAGGLWFNDQHLYDYDGVFAIPTEVAEALTAWGYIVSKDCLA